LKILHVLKSGHFAGAENVVIQIIKMMSELDTVKSLYVSSKGKIEEVLTEKSIDHYLVDNLNIKNLKEIIEKYQPDIIHAHDFQASVLCSIVKKKRILISHIHCNPEWLRGLNLKTLSYLISSFRFDKILTVSPQITEDYIFGDIIRKKVHNIGNPINTNSIKRLAAIEVQENKYDVIFIGRLEEVKNPFKFIEIIEKIKKDVPEVKAIMVGGGTLYRECSEIIKEKSLDTNIDLVGYQKNPYKFLNNSKFLCITSLNEGFSLVAVEAITLGKPVISFDVGELRSIVNNDCGLVTNNEDEIIIECLKLINDEKLLKNKSSAASAKSLKLDNYSEFKRFLQDLYRMN